MDQQWERLLSLYDTPDPVEPDKTLKGYDRDHAARTTAISIKVAQHLGYTGETLHDFEVTCLLHDLGRAGLDQAVFGRIFTLAAQEGDATRPRELRAQYLDIMPGQETDAFIRIMDSAFHREGIQADALAREQIEMRLGFKERMLRKAEEFRETLSFWGVVLKPWMMKVILYYYYPEEIEVQPSEVQRLGRILVACEQFEARNNRERGRDYYRREKETLRDAFDYMEALKGQGSITDDEIRALAYLTCQRQFDSILLEARQMSPGSPLPEEDLSFIEELCHSL